MVDKVIVEQDVNDITVLSIKTEPELVKNKFGVVHHTISIKLLMSEDIFKKCSGVGLFKCFSPMNSDLVYFDKNYFKSKKQIRKKAWDWMTTKMKGGADGRIIEVKIRCFKVPPGTYNPMRVHLKPYVMFKQENVRYRNWDAHPTPDYCLELGGVGEFDRSNELLE